VLLVKVFVILILVKIILCVLKITKVYVVIIVNAILLYLPVCNFLNFILFLIVCIPFFAGDYCEHELQESCPISWWGHHRGVCGPCNCMVDNGYNPHCNKTTGQCYCKVILN